MKMMTGPATLHVALEWLRRRYIAEGWWWDYVCLLHTFRALWNETYDEISSGQVEVGSEKFSQKLRHLSVLVQN